MTLAWSAEEYAALEAVARSLQMTVEGYCEMQIAHAVRRAADLALEPVLPGSH